VEYLDRAIAFAREHDILLVHDNAYSEIGFDGYRPPSLLERPGAREVAIELFSCSKAYNMTGWRVAFAAGNAAAIKALGTVKSNIDSGVFTAVQDAAIEAMLGPKTTLEMSALPAPTRLVMDAQPIGLRPGTQRHDTCGEDATDTRRLSRVRCWTRSASSSLRATPTA
jgi:LL-diaminopimelate aminotransferase